MQRCVESACRFARFRGAAGDDDLTGTNDAVVQFVAPLDFFQHRHRGLLARRQMPDRLMQIRVERLTDRFDGNDRVSNQRVVQLLFDHLDTVDQAVCITLRAISGVHCASEVVQGRQQVADKSKRLVLAELFVFLWTRRR